MTDAAVLLLCQARSGSNLLRALINQHPDVFISPGFALYRDLEPVVDAYGDLSDDVRLDRLLSDICDLLSASHLPVPLPVTPSLLPGRLAGRSRTLGTIVQEIHALQAEARGCRISGSKENNHFDRISRFVDQSNHSHIVYMYRDPRDVVLSHLKSRTSAQPPDVLGRTWLEKNRCIQDICARFPGKVFELSYESLIANPDGTASAIWTFLGLAQPPAYRPFHQDAYEVQLAGRTHMLENLKRPIIPNNTEKYYEEWNCRDVRRVEKAVGIEALQAFGYRKARWFRFKSLTRKPQLVSEERFEDHKALHGKRRAILKQIRQRMDAPAA